MRKEVSYPRDSGRHGTPQDGRYFEDFMHPEIKDEELKSICPK
jgi:hypothetical protein